LNLDVLTPVGVPGWDRMVADGKTNCIFHCAYWARVLQETYGYKPCYMTQIKENRFAALVPLMEVDSPITGRRGVSLPFSDFCEWIVPEDLPPRELLSSLLEFGRRRKWKYLITTGGLPPEKENPPAHLYFLHTLSLSPDEKTVYRKFSGPVRRNIGKAVRSGVRIRQGETLQDMREFHRLNCMSRKRHGLVPQPFRFFRNVFEIIITQGHGKLFLASFEDQIIAGGVFLCSGDKAVFKYGASDYAYQDLRANNLLFWNAIVWCCKQGMRELSFGKTEADNQGLRRFKAAWGANESTVLSHRYDFGKEGYVPNPTLVKGFHNRILGALPSGLLSAAGSLLYKHFG